MATEPEETLNSLPDVDSEDLWVRGQVYAHHKRMLAQAEAQIPGLERDVARARYEHEITQRIRDKVTDPEARKNWEIRASVAHDFMVMAEHRLAEVVEDVTYYRATVAEMEDDLGDKAQEYEAILAEFGWEEGWGEDWSAEDFDEYGEFDEFDRFAPIPF